MNEKEYKKAKRQALISHAIQQERIWLTMQHQDSIELATDGKPLTEPTIPTAKLIEIERLSNQLWRLLKQPVDCTRTVANGDYVSLYVRSIYDATSSMFYTAGKADDIIAVLKLLNAQPHLMPNDEVKLYRAKECLAHMETQLRAGNEY